MSALYSYVCRYDSGAAPNPFFGVCTLVLCKPTIRRTATVGDWIVGTGSTANRHRGDLRGRLIYVMRVSQKMTMQDYDAWTRRECVGKSPDPRASDYARRVGDSLYDFSQQPPRLRPGVHGEKDRERDLRGGFALLSNRFLYFGANAPRLPDHLQHIVLPGQGHRRIMEASTSGRFIAWLETLGVGWNQLHGPPADPLRHGDSCDPSASQSCVGRSRRAVERRSESC
jgi:hypothetical protein